MIKSDHLSENFKDTCWIEKYFMKEFDVLVLTNIQQTNTLILHFAVKQSNSSQKI